MASSLKRKNLGEKAQDQQKRPKLTKEIDDIPEDVVKDDEEIEDEELDLEELSEEDEDEEEMDSELDMDSDSSITEDDTSATKKVKKRNDPSVFANSISKILSSKVTSKDADSDPVLARSKSAFAATHELNTSRLEEKARRRIREEKRARLDKGRVVDVLGLQNPELSTSEIQEQERRYKKMAQRGAVLLFNAIRAAQSEAEKAAVASRIGNAELSGRDTKEENVTEMSKKGFLELIARGGKK